MSRYRTLAVLAAMALTAACQGNQGNQPMTDAVRSQVATEIRTAADSMIAGFNRHDASIYIDQLSDVQSYAENAMMYPSRDSLVSAVNGMIAATSAMSLAWTGEPTVVVVSPDAGVISGRFHETITNAAGVTQAMDGLWTGLYQRIGGSWKVVVAHESYAPVMGSEGA